MLFSLVFYPATADECRWQSYSNPLAEHSITIEDARGVRPLMPPPPHSALRGDLGLQRGTFSGIGRISRARLAEWLGRAGLDPNDPRNSWCDDALIVPVSKWVGSFCQSASRCCVPPPAGMSSC